MPLTFPSHAAAVLPLKLWRPRRFDGIALVVGSASTDLAYPFAAIVPYPTVHSVPGLFWWCLPVTALLTWLIRRAAPRVAAHLPGRGPLRLRDYGAVGAVRHGWHVTLGSALIGAASHLLWDGFTHSPQTNGWAVALMPALAAPVAGVPWYRLLQHASSLVGAAVAIGALARIGRRRLIFQWYGPPPPVVRRPRLFWATAAAVLAGYPLTWPLLTHLYQPHVQGARLLCFAGCALLAGAAASALADRAHGRQPAGGPATAKDRRG